MTKQPRIAQCMKFNGVGCPVRAIAKLTCELRGAKRRRSESG